MYMVHTSHYPRRSAALARIETNEFLPVRQAQPVLADTASDGNVSDQTVVDALAARLDDEDSDVRAAACEAIGQLGLEQAKPPLEGLRIDPDSQVSRAASHALRQLE